MADTTATLAGHRVTYARVSIPAWGAWYADVNADGEFTLTGAQTFTINDATFKGTVLSGGPANGRSFYRLIAGAGGWGKTLKRKSYSNDAGVKLTTVLGDAASEAGETLDTSTFDTSIRLGPGWVRPEDIAGRVLELVSPGSWYVDLDGKTKLGKRASVTLSATVPRTSQLDLARGTITLAPESIATLLPGIQVDSLTAVDVEHEMSPKGGLRTTIWGKSFSQTSRRLSAYRAIVDQVDPDRMFRGVTEYRVVTLSGKRANLQPVRSVLGMPDLQNVPARPGVSGCYATLTLGSRVLVGFVDSSPARPYMAAFEDAEGEGFVPTLLTIAEGVQGVARLGDSVQAGPYVGVITSASTKVLCG